MATRSLLQRAGRQSSTVAAEMMLVRVDIKAVVKMDQETFLSNDKNKEQQINFLRDEFQKISILVKIADEDADVLIVQTAIDLAQETVPIVIEEDTDLLVLLMALTPSEVDIKFYKPAGNMYHQFSSIFDRLH
ncbi:hypothetical protein V9T40_009322 [Parthenolecanium corni]|uniref:Uncharacterized protein n=1 Tax=Parthenolecanium corni TaxID=536013 RepID=A0AAN9Y7E3_9HEMI